MADDDTTSSGTRVATEEVVTLNGVATTPDSSSRLPKAQRVLGGFSEGDGVFRDVSAAHPQPVTDAGAVAAIDGLLDDVAADDALKTRPAGTYGYRSGTGAATVDVPTDARIKSVNVLAGASPATVTVLGGDMITIPAGTAFGRDVPGEAIATSGSSEVVIGGTVSTFYVDWVVYATQVNVS